MLLAYEHTLWHDISVGVNLFKYQSNFKDVKRMLVIC